MKNTAFRFAIAAAFKSLTLAAFFLSFNIAARAVGVLDSTFGTNGRISISIGAQASASAVVIQPDGKIIVVGELNRGNTNLDVVLIRLNPNGTLDTSFGDGGKVFAVISTGVDRARDVALAPDGKIVVAGSKQAPDSATNTDFFVARFNASGTLDTGFGNNGVATVNQGSNDDFRAVVVQPDGKIVAAGRTSDGDRAAIIRFNINGTLDDDFIGDGLFFYNVPNTTFESFEALALYPNGRIVAGGQGQSAGSSVNNIIMVLEPNGTPAQNFGNQGVVLTNEFVSSIISLGFDLALTPEGKILTVGARTRRYLNNGAADPTFDASPATIEPYGSAVAVRPDGNFITARFNPEFDTVIRNANGRFIGRAANITGSDVAAQTDGKFILVRSSGNDFVVTRLLAITSQGTRVADYDSDDKTDIAVLRPSSSTLYVSRSSDGFAAYNSGEASFEIRRVMPEEYGFRFPQPFVYWKSGNIIGSPASFCGTNGAGARRCEQWGMLGDLPVGGDYDGDTFTDVAVFRPENGVWYISQSSNNQSRAVQWGLSGDKPVPADYDYDGITDVAVYRPSTGFWWVRRSSDGSTLGVQFGAPSDIPLTGDYDGDGRADFVVFRPSSGIWYQFLTTQGFRAVQFGSSTDKPVPGDYDGDGRHDLGVFRQGVWYLLQSTAGFRAVQFGAASNMPVSVRYDE